MTSISYGFADGHWAEVECTEEFKEKYEFLLVREQGLRWKEMKQKERAGLKCSEDFSLHRFYEDGGDLPSSEHDPLEIIVKREEASFLKQKLLAKLTSRQREIYILFEFKGYKKIEIAKMLNISEVAIRKHLKAANKNILKNFLK